MEKLKPERLSWSRNFYNEALATIAVLRPTGAATESMIRVRVDRQWRQSSLPVFHGSGGRMKVIDGAAQLLQ